MAITDNWGAMVGFLGLLMAQGAASAESKFLFLKLAFLAYPLQKSTSYSFVDEKCESNQPNHCN